MEHNSQKTIRRYVHTYMYAVHVYAPYRKWVMVDIIISNGCLVKVDIPTCTFRYLWYIVAYFTAAGV